MKHPGNPQDRIIFALDVPDIELARSYVKQLDGLISFYKVGWELFLATGLGFVKELKEQQLKVFLDLKLTPDIPAQLQRATQTLARAGIECMTVHGNGKTIEMVKAGRGETKVQILSLTVLTSMSEHDMRDLYITGSQGASSAHVSSVEEFVDSRAHESLQHGADGLIASGLHAAMLREKHGNEFLLVCPGIRPSGVSHNEHQRAATPTQAVKGGADYLVIGRPIRDAANPREAVKKIIGEIEEGLSV
ncbi:MAG: orotidine-5'-phosphate decarboxylase [Nitrospirales bacterium]|nr:orotidine-5'-phosphate decarboxylase [Nitrospirales bacterium]